MYIPSSWKQINFEQFLKLQKIEIENKSPIKIWAERLSIITDESPEYFLNENFELFKLYISQASFLNTVIEEQSNQFTIDDKTYLIPEHFAKLSGGQFADCDILIKEKGEAAIPELIAISVQDSKSYDYEAAMKLANKIRTDIDAEQLFKLSNFFLSVEKTSLVSSLKSLKKELMNQMEKEVQNYKTITLHGGGIRNFLKRLQITIFFKWIKLQIYRLDK